MKNNVCPKCGSNEIIRVPGTTNMYSRSLTTGVFSGTVEVAHYICASCGFSEEWVESASDIMTLKKKFGTGIH